MKRDSFFSHGGLVIGAAVMAGLLLVMGLYQPGQAAPASGFAADSPTSTPAGASIALAVTGAPAGAWTSVQWQDGLGQWHPVDGWQAQLDPTTHQRLWFVGNSLLGNPGLFRWVVYASQGGPVWATSLVFHLPAISGLVAWSDIYGPDQPAAPPPAPAATFAPVPTAFVPAAPVVPLTTAASPAAGTYVVQRGDTLYGIALQFQTTIGALQAQNGLTGSLIFPGQVLVIPGGSSASVAVPAATPIPLPAPVGLGTGSIYVVQRGDTLYGIALRFGTTVGAIQAANQLNGSLILVGQRLIIP